MVPLHQSVIWLAPCHHISQSFDLPTATTSVSHLTCPLPPYHQSELVLEIELVLALDIERYHITASIIWLAPCHHISQSFDLPTATTSVSHLTCPLPLHYHIGQSFDLPPPHQSIIRLAPTTTSVNHLTCPYHHISQSFDLPTATTSSVRASAGASTRDRASASARHRALWYHCISQSFDLPPATTSVSHLTCPLPPHQSVIWLAHCHHIISQS